MKKIITVALSLVFVTSTVLPASSAGLSGIRNTSKSFTMWHFNRDEGPKIVEAFNEKYPNINVNLTIVPDKDRQYQIKLAAAIKSGAGVPDVITLESSFVKQFINMDNAMYDITEAASYITSDMYPYTLDIGKNNSGKLMASL